jgi:steroid delta-isomerase
MSATPEQVIDAMKKYVQAWGTNDKKLFLTLFAEDARWSDPVGTPEFKGLAGVEKFWDFAHQGTDRQLSPKVEEMRACANEGILRFVMQVRIPSKNQGLDLSIVDYFVLDDAGKIQSARAFWDGSHASVPAGMQMFAPNVEEAYDK